MKPTQTDMHPIIKVIGIDNGFKGAIAVKSHEGIEVYDMPVMTIKNKSRLDGEKIKEIFYKVKPDHIFIEQAWAMPKQGVVSMFSIGFGFGFMCGIIEGLVIPYTVVSSKKWQSRFFASQGNPKDMAYETFLKLYPQAKQMVIGPKGGIRDGRVDAILIATYGFDILSQNAKM